MKSIYYTFLVVLIVSFGCTAQKIGASELKETREEVISIGFYNLENLFDTIVDPDPNKILQDDFTPDGVKNFTSVRYHKKLENLSQVIAEFGKEENADGPAILGVCEVENKQVLEDLVQMPLIANRDYKIVHYDSPDKRGIDVALLYQEKYFQYENSQVVPLIDPNNADFNTRDQLIVSGKLQGEPFHFVVAHWPSRRGGKEKSEPKRDMAAELGRHLVDSLLSTNESAKVIYMGDLNDNPNDHSLKEVMGAKGDIDNLNSGDLYNSMESIYEEGIGTLVYRGDWFLFDQLLCSENIMTTASGDLTFKEAKVYDSAFLRQASGKYQNTPLRTYGGRKWLDGFSDHFPVYLHLKKAK